MIEEEKKNRMVSIMNMHAVKCLLTIFGGGKGIPGRLTRLLQVYYGLMIPRKHSSKQVRSEAHYQLHTTNDTACLSIQISDYRSE